MILSVSQHLAIALVNGPILTQEHRDSHIMRYNLSVPCRSSALMMTDKFRVCYLLPGNFCS